MSHNSSLVPEPIRIYEPAVLLRTCHRSGCSGALSFLLAFCHSCPLFIAEDSGISSHQQWVNYMLFYEKCSKITNKVVLISQTDDIVHKYEYKPVCI